MQSFQPPRRILMGPGPSDVTPRVLAALARPTIGHLDPQFQDLMEEIKAALARLFNAPDHACVPLPAPGTAGMEAAIMNLLEPGDRAVIAINGVFGGRMADMAGRAGATVAGRKRLPPFWPRAGRGRSGSASSRARKSRSTPGTSSGGRPALSSASRPIRARTRTRSITG